MTDVPLPTANPLRQPTEGDGYTIPTRPDNSPFGKEQATIIANGINFSDWENVWVSLKMRDSWAFFKFSSVERDVSTLNLKDVAAWYSNPQFMTGTPVQINLGGVNVIKGMIETRQVAYDSGRHGIELQGKSATGAISRSSVNTKTGNLDGLNWLQAAQKVTAGHNTKVIPVGQLNNLPFPKLQVQPGEAIWDFMDRTARPRGIILGSDSFGNFLAIGKHTMPVLDTKLVEGQNIKRCQCVFHKEHTYAEYRVLAQSNASDGNAFKQAAEIVGKWAGTGPLGSILITPSEQTVMHQQEAIDRAKFEALLREGPTIEASITVQGWFRDESNLWWPGDNVFVYSPMCPLNMLMKIQNVTFTQDNNSGTETTLTLVQPWALNDQAAQNPSGSSTATSPPGPVPEGGGVPPTP